MIILIVGLTLLIILILAIRKIREIRKIEEELNDKFDYNYYESQLDKEILIADKKSDLIDKVNILEEKYDKLKSRNNETK